MRLRNVPGSREYIENSPYAIKNAETLKVHGAVISEKMRIHLYL